MVLVTCISNIRSGWFWLPVFPISGQGGFGYLYFQYQVRVLLVTYISNIKSGWFWLPIFPISGQGGFVYLYFQYQIRVVLVTCISNIRSGWFWLPVFPISGQGGFGYLYFQYQVRVVLVTYISNIDYYAREPCHDLSHIIRKPTMWFLNRSDTNQAVQAQKMVRGLKFWIKKVEETNVLISTC